MGLISEEFWDLVAPLMPSNEGRQGHPFTVDHRVILEGIAWRYRTGSPWRDVPECFGSWKTIWKRHHRFSTDGTYQRMQQTVCAHYGIEPGDAGIQQVLSVDSTMIRAHQHAAGARREPGVVVARCSPDTGG